MLMTETVLLRSTPSTPDYDEAWYEPVSSREAADRRQQQLYGFVVYLPLAADVDGADAVVIEGEEYAVVGEPQRQPSGFIVDGFQRVIVERVTG